MGFQQGFRINTNTASLDTYRAYSKSQVGLEQNIERLSSGLAINSAKDDAAGLAISERMNNQVRGMQQANRNVQQANNLLQTAEGGLNEISNILGRMRELAVQSASDGVNGGDRASIDLEFQQLKAEITRIGDGTEYNNMKVLNGTLGNNLNGQPFSLAVSTDVKIWGYSAVAGDYFFQAEPYSNGLTISSSDGRSETVLLPDTITSNEGSNTIEFKTLGITLENTGADINGTIAGSSFTTVVSHFEISGGVTIQSGPNNTPSSVNMSQDRINFSIYDYTADSTSGGLSISTVSLDSLAGAQGAINKLDTAIGKVNDSRSNIGAMQNRLEFTSSNLMNSVQNNSASMSTIRDADFAAEAADLAKNQILTQSGTAMLAQANSLSQNVLSLIR